MKDPFVRTKVVVRHLPPSLSQSALSEQIDARFNGRYKWFSFSPGKNSQKHQKYSRAYIDFRKPEDVVEFAEFFDGHVFVTEKGTQIRAIVEYAPSQRVPKSWCKKDGRGGTIHKDPEYLEFLEFLSKPVENLPSAEIQLEKRDAERAGASKEPKVTALMDFIRKERANMEKEKERLATNGKPSRRAMGASPGNSRQPSSKRGSEKRRGSTSTYVMRDSAKNVSGKDKPTYIIATRPEDPSPSDKPVSAAAEGGAAIVADEIGTSGAVDLGKKKVTLLRGKDRENIPASQQQSGPSPVRNNSGSPAFTHRQQRRELGGRMIRNILNKDNTRQGQSSATPVQSEQQPLHSDRERRPPRSNNLRPIPKDNLSSVSESDFKTRAADGFGAGSERQERQMRNRDRPDRSVWSNRRSDVSRGSDENLSLSESLEGVSINNGNYSSSSHFDARSVGDIKILGSNRAGPSSVENGAHNRYGGRRGPAHGSKDADGSVYPNDGKPPKRGGPHETKQKWVQKSGSGS
ncbi:hypothetical protein ACHQM5_015345 [Ranunculus cassubicifolius]